MTLNYKDLSGPDRRTVRNVVRWLRSEGALSASVALPSGRGVVVYRNKRIERALTESSHA